MVNYDYKILARVMAMRIGSQQVGFLKGCNIAFNIRKTAKVVTYLNKNNKPEIIVTIDFEKCYDRVEYSAIRGTLKYFNFGDTFIDWLFLLFNNFYIYVPRIMEIFLSCFERDGV